MRNAGVMDPASPEDLFLNVYKNRGDIAPLLDKSISFSKITEIEKEYYTLTARKSCAEFQLFLHEFFADFLVEPRQTIELVIAILKHYYTHIDYEVYVHAIYIVVPLMTLLTEEDCLNFLSNLNCQSFYVDGTTGERVQFEPPSNDFPTGYEGEHVLYRKYPHVFPFATDLFMLTYVKLVLNKNFWANPARHSMAIEVFKPKLVAFYAPQFIPLLMDMYTFFIVSKDFDYFADSGVNIPDGLGVFCKILPIAKLAYQKGGIQHQSIGHFKDFLLSNKVKPAEVDKPFLVKESDHMWGIAPFWDLQKQKQRRKLDYMKDLQSLCQMKEWKMLSDEVECIFSQQIGYTSSENCQNNETTKNEQTNPSPTDKTSEQTDEQKESKGNIQASSSSSSNSITAISQEDYTCFVVGNARRDIMLC
eukprot:TRINITY_DN4192_c0_g3_i1.p1 TRINITY_DN4192_c0_g3~~TRINITY_DN4192_c0_g3_i1.p1  ORF type:complete len:418 (+),score=62.47 TRINITY_DN4192_c0_g3_i1:340-1593(+)